MVQNRIKIEEHKDVKLEWGVYCAQHPQQYKYNKSVTRKRYYVTIIHLASCGLVWHTT